MKPFTIATRPCNWHESLFLACFWRYRTIQTSNRLSYPCKKPWKNTKYFAINMQPLLSAWQASCWKTSALYILKAEQSRGCLWIVTRSVLWSVEFACHSDVFEDIWPCSANSWRLRFGMLCRQWRVNPSEQSTVSVLPSTSSTPLCLQHCGAVLLLRRKICSMALQKTAAILKAISLFLMASESGRTEYDNSSSLADWCRRCHQLHWQKNTVCENT